MSRGGTTATQRMAYGAMANQLDRVNAANASQRIADLEQEVAHLQELLQIARRQIAEKDARIAELEAAAKAPVQMPLPAPFKGRPAPNLVYKGRAATTAQRAADYYGVSLSTITRRLHAGKIAGEQLPGSNRWIVFLDCEISTFQKKGPQKK
jgi:CRP-like cAMP-binding protein